MSRNYANYPQYLGALKCCDLRTQGPLGPPGPTGPQAIGQMGNTGPTGASVTGPTGRSCKGDTGAKGPTGSSQWVSSNYQGVTGSGYTGIGYTGDAMIFGALYVSGGIDPTYLALEPQPSGPTGFVNPLWVDLSGNLRSDKIKLANGTDTLTLNETNITHTNATTGLTITSNQDIRIDTTKIVYVGDTNGSVNGTNIAVDDVNRNIFLSDSNATTYLEVNGSSGKVSVATDNGFQLIGTSIQYPSDYITLSVSLDATSLYAQTFNGPSRTATLPLVDNNNVGFQYLITNTNATSLTVTSTGGQLIYSTIAPASATSRTLAQGNSHIFTAIRTTAPNAYGWSMV